MTRHLPLIALPLLILGIWLAYGPGLHGTFLFDDFNNLGQIGAYGAVDNLRSLLLYLTSGNADPIGRPLALLSFLLDADDWPATPEPFKRTNILLHLLNAALLCWTLLKLGRRLGVDELHAQRAAMLGGALWALHPFFVSTTLYVVQREAMLPSTFSLLGVMLWLSGKERSGKGARGGLLLMIAGAWGCTALAMLCKANGVLLPLLLLIMECTIPELRPREIRRGLISAQTVLLGIPSAITGLWLLWKLPTAFHGEAFGRPWTVGQRLLTEPRVVCDYLLNLAVPRATGTSIFTDGYVASTGWLQPHNTLPCMAITLLLPAVAYALRRDHPAFAFAILFYFAGQLLESTLIPLELYFEHRNYLPAMMLFWPLSLWLTGRGPLPLLRGALSVMLPLLLAYLCHARADIWGSPYLQTALLAKLDPASARAQATAATYETGLGRPDLAIVRLRSTLARMPSEAQLALNLVDSECAVGAVSTSALAAAGFAISHNQEHAELIQNWLVRKIGDAPDQKCTGLTLDTLDALTQAFRDNPHYSKAAGRQLELWQLQGRLALARHNRRDALQAFNTGLAAFPTPDAAMLEAALLGSYGYPREGLEHLRYYERLKPADRALTGMPALHLWLLGHYHYWDDELNALIRELTADVASEPDAPSASGR